MAAKNNNNFKASSFTRAVYPEILKGLECLMQQTDWQKTLEVVVKGFVGAIVALAGLWVLGWVFTFLGSVLIGLAGIVVALLKFLVPVAVIAAIVYFVVSQVQSSSKPNTYEAKATPKPPGELEAQTINISVSKPEAVKMTENTTEEKVVERQEKDV
jgi:hypothetical protein